MKNLLKKIFLKKKEDVKEEVVEKFDYDATIFMKKGGYHKVRGHYPSHKETLDDLKSFIIENAVFSASTTDGEWLVIRGEDIDFVRVVKAEAQEEKEVENI